MRACGAIVGWLLINTLRSAAVLYDWSARGNDRTNYFFANIFVEINTAVLPLSTYWRVRRRFIRCAWNFYIVSRSKAIEENIPCADNIEQVYVVQREVLADWLYYVSLCVRMYHMLHIYPPFCSGETDHHLSTTVASFAAALAVCVIHLMSTMVSKYSYAAVLLFGIIIVWPSTSWRSCFLRWSARRSLSLQMRCNWISTCTHSGRVRRFKRKRARPDEREIRLVTACSF